MVLAQVHIFDLRHMKYRGHLPQPEDGMCVSSMAFNALGTMLAAATAGGGLMLYQVASRRVAPWHIANSSTLMERLAAVPAAICDLSFSPDPKVTDCCTLGPSSRPVPWACASCKLSFSPDPRLSCILWFSPVLLFHCTALPCAGLVPPEIRSQPAFCSLVKVGSPCLNLKPSNPGCIATSACLRRICSEEHNCGACSHIRNSYQNWCMLF